MARSPIDDDPKGTVGVPLSPSSSIDKARVKDSESTVSTDTSDLQPPLDEKPRFTDLLFNRKKSRVDPDNIATRRSVFDDPILARHYWPSPKYENLHRFDPTARWSFKEEKVRYRSFVMRCRMFIRLSRPLSEKSIGESWLGPR